MVFFNVFFATSTETKKNPPSNWESWNLGLEWYKILPQNSQNLYQAILPPSWCKWREKISRKLVLAGGLKLCIWNKIIQNHCQRVVVTVYSNPCKIIWEQLRVKIDKRFPLIVPRTQRALAPWITRKVPIKLDHFPKDRDKHVVQT